MDLGCVSVIACDGKFELSHLSHFVLILVTDIRIYILSHLKLCIIIIWNITIVCVCYIDYEKAFDRVDWTKLMMILQKSILER